MAVSAVHRSTPASTEQSPAARMPGASATAGTCVEVHSKFTGRWVPGFSVAEAGEGGYRLRRQSDHSLLPEWIPAEDVRVTG